MWGDLSEVQIIRTPRTVLLEQAQFLTEATKGTLVGVVREGPSARVFQHDLLVKVPSLNNYQVNILQVEHEIDLYPASLVASRTNTIVVCKNEAEFEKAVAFKSKVRDITEYLAGLGIVTPLRPLKPLYLRVTYQDSCHLLHGQKVRNAPRDLLKQIPGLELVELPQRN